MKGSFGAASNIIASWRMLLLERAPDGPHANTGWPPSRLEGRLDSRYRLDDTGRFLIATKPLFGTRMITRAKIIRWIFSLLLALVILASPFFLFYGLFGLAGSAPAYYYLLVIVGYLALIVSLIIIIWKPGTRNIPMTLMILVPAGLVFTGLYLDSRFWSQHNENLCAELRAEPSCKEDACGFSCDKFHGYGFTTGASICKDKDLNLCHKQILEGKD